MVRKKAMESYFKEGFNIPYSDEEINTWYDNGVYKYKETGTGYNATIVVKLK